MDASSPLGVVGVQLAAPGGQILRAVPMRERKQPAGKIAKPSTRTSNERDCMNAKCEDRIVRCLRAAILPEKRTIVTHHDASGVAQERNAGHCHAATESAGRPR
jgi:hypothetical protein